MPVDLTQVVAAFQAGRDPRPDETETVGHVLAVALAWDAGQLPLWEAARQGTGYERWTATRFTSPTDPAFPVLMRLLDALIADPAGPSYGIGTKHGRYGNDDLREAGARVRRIGARLRIDFPIRRPWRRPPNRETGDPGERGDPIYAEDPKARWRIANGLDRPAPQADRRGRWDPAPTGRTGGA